MNLLTDTWIPVRATGGTGPFQQISFEELLCGEGKWWVSLPRDDFELACQQLLVCLAQVLFLPANDQVLRERLRKRLSAGEYAEAIKSVVDWFDLDHSEAPFMQTRGVKAAETTPIQKLLIGLPEGNNHSFFNDVGEVRHLGASCAAIALFNQASNCPSFGGGFKGSLRGGAPVTTLVNGDDLRETVWKNVLSLPRVQEFLPGYELDYGKDNPTWIIPIKKDETIFTKDIGLIRGLFWQPARVELIRSTESGPCDLLGSEYGHVYSGFKAEKFSYNINGLWPHPHGAQTASFKKGQVQWKYVSFTTTAPAWTQLTEFVVPSPWNEDTREGSIPAAPVRQSPIVFNGGLHLLIGGYRNKQASVLERRHELMSLASGWADEKGRVKQLVELGKKARAALRGQLYYAAKGNKTRELKGIGGKIHEVGEKLFYSGTETLLHEVLRQDMTFREFKQARDGLARKLGGICRSIFEQLTDPYAMKPELIPIIAAARRSLNSELTNLIEGVQQHGEKRTKRKAAKS